MEIFDSLIKNKMDFVCKYANSWHIEIKKDFVLNLNLNMLIVDQYKQKGILF